MAVFGYDVGASDPLEGSPTDRAVFSALMMLAGVVLIQRRTDWVRLAKANQGLILLLLYMLFSMAWSDYPEVTFKRWTKVLADLFMALIVLTEREPLEAECTVITRVMFVTIPLSIIFIKYFRSYGTDWNEFGMEMWTGATPHKNVLGQVVMTGALCFAFELIQKRRQLLRAGSYAIYLAMAAWLLRGSDASRSNTAVLGCLLGLVLLFGLQCCRSRVEALRRYLVVCLPCAACVLALVQLVQVAGTSSIVTAGIEASGRDVTLTGRTELWSDLWTISRDRPILGVGYGAFWVGNTHDLWDKHLWKPNQGHNGYLDVYLELGTVGFLLFIGTTVGALSRLVKQLTIDFEQAVLHIVWLVVILCHNLTESSFLRGSVDLWFIFLLSTVFVPMSLRQASAPGEAVALRQAHMALDRRARTTASARLTRSVRPKGSLNGVRRS